MGYGESSWLYGLTHSDTLTRLLYAILLSLPFLFWGIKRWAVCAVVLILAFQIHAGSLFTFGTFDVLIEDIVRYGALGLLLIPVVFSPK